MINKTRIGLLGGSFNPVHNGHIQLALEAKKQYGLKSVYFIPAWHPPHKDRSSLASAYHRLNMLSLALKKYPFLKICRFELNQKKVVFTYETLTYFKNRFANCDLYFIIGTDSLAELGRWKNSDELAALSFFIAGKRPGYRHSVPNKFKNRVLFLKGSIKNISSTAIRASSVPGVPRMPSKVADYIKRFGLYSRE